MDEISRAIAALEKLRANAPAVTITVAELWDRYRPVARQNRSWRGNFTQAGHLVRLLGDALVMDLTAAKVAAFERARRAEKPLTKKDSEAGCSVATVNRELALLKRMCTWGADEAQGLIPHSPVARIHKKPEHNTREVVYSDEDINRMVAACPTIHGRNGPTVAALILLLRDGGMRLGEARLLEFTDIDSQARMIHLRAKATKTRRGRVTRISERALDAIERINWPDKRWLFENPRLRRPFRTAMLSSWIREIVKYLGLRGPNGETPYAHDLRRTFSTMLRRKGVPEGVIMKMTGHLSRATFDRYGIVGPEDVQTAHRILDKHERRQPLPDRVPLRRDK